MSPLFKVEIKTDNAAFHADDRDDDGHDSAACGAELARILRELARGIEDGIAEDDGGNVRDVNGNTVGKWWTLA